MYFPSWHKQNQTLDLNLVARLNKFRLANIQKEYPASCPCLLQTTLQLIMHCLNATLVAKNCRLNLMSDHQPRAPKAEQV